MGIGIDCYDFGCSQRESLELNKAFSYSLDKNIGPYILDILKKKYLLRFQPKVKFY